MERAFFANSGAEANEAAIKLVRLHTPEKKYKIITFEGGFHGRTLGSLTATAQPKYHEGLGPLMAGFVYAPFGELDAVAAPISNPAAVHEAVSCFSSASISSSVINWS